MAIAVTLIVLVCLVGVNIFLWKSGFLFDAERPKLVMETTVKDPEKRRAALLRVSRWKAQGRITREEAERWTALCEEHWDLKDN